jgi:hypothetical protein
MTREQRRSRIEQLTDQLSELLDAVQVLGAELMPDGRTNTILTGRGLWHARQGLAQEFIETSQAMTLVHEMNREDEEDDD